MSHLMRFPNRHHFTSVASLPWVKNWRPVTVALFASLAPLAIWQIDTIREAASQPLGGLALGVILGTMTGLAFVAHQRGRR